jgi:hypothetical protein
MVVATNWTSLGVSRFYKYLCACLHHIWSNSLTQLFRLVSKIGKLLSSTWSILCWISPHSELVSAFADNRESQSEIPKAATEHDRWRALAKCSKHLLPVGIIASLLALNFSTISWMAPEGANQDARLNALQFAAKVHEIHLLSSLSLIVLDHVQFELLRGRGIPIEGLFAGFQVGDVASLWKPGLWTTPPAKNKSTHGALLALLFVVSIIVGAVSGPSSAILMLPSLDLWTEPLTPCESKKYFGASSDFFIDPPHPLAGRDHHVELSTSRLQLHGCPDTNPLPRWWACRNARLGFCARSWPYCLESHDGSRPIQPISTRCSCQFWSQLRRLRLVYVADHECNGRQRFSIFECCV